MSEPKAKRMPGMTREYWRGELLRAADSIDAALGAFYYRTRGDGRELLTDRPADRAKVESAARKLSEAQNLIRDAHVSLHGIDLNFS